MKYLTIRMKVTLWYAFFMLVLIGVSLLVITELSGKAMLANQQENLIETVNDGVNEIDSPGDFNFFENGIYLLLYDKKETYINGVIPDGFSSSLALQHDSVQSIETGSQNFYVYDKSFEKDGDFYWMRGVIHQSGPDPIGALLVTIVSGFLPIFVLLTCIIGYFITKRAFRPIKKIQETAQNIADSDELSLRIGLPEGKDEVAKLGETMDHMLDKLEKSFEKEKQFTSDVSHELRTPLAVILTESEFALQHADTLEDAKESMEVVNRQANRMSTLINQLLFFSRSDQGSLRLNDETFDAFTVVSELVQDYQSLVENEDITISITNGSEKNSYITADKMLFIRSLSNIIQNAINYSKPSGHIDIKTSQKDHFLAIEVADDGIGIHTENLEKIWNRFYQVEESRSKTKGDSMGLGLSMVKTIVETHGGYVSVNSVFEQGSTFTLHFPL